VQAVASSFLVGRLIDLSNALSAALILSGTDGLSSAAGEVTNQASPTVALLVLVVLVVLAVDLLLVLSVVRVLALSAATLLGLLAVLIGIPLMAAAKVAFPARRSLVGMAIAGVMGR